MLKETTLKRETDKLRPTVKRDLSLFSIFSWQLGYTKYFKEYLDWWYDIYFYYDGTKVNFYHKVKDFEYFKKTITENLQKDKRLFTKLNTALKKNVEELVKISSSEISILSLQNISELIGKIMSLYIFIVSDSFIEAQQDAWESRHLSEGILYIMDEKVEQFMKEQLTAQKYNEKLAHVISFNEFSSLIHKKSINIYKINERLSSYILYNDQLITNIAFTKYCQENHLINPETVESIEIITSIHGTVASQGGIIKGRAKVIHTREDFNKIQSGDILISIMTNANFTPIMKKVAAIVTDEGGVTCHAAIIAREFGIPCIVGTKIATKTFKDGDYLNVDTISGIVNKERTKTQK